VTYYYVSHDQRGAGQQGQMNYGGTGQQQPKRPQHSGVVSTDTAPASVGDATTGSSSSEQRVPRGDSAPPTYTDAVKGDNKVQTDD